MEATKKLAAQEELRLKLLEYLAAKGKLKPPNSKPYLKDCTNLQKKRPQESSKQIGEKSAPKKGSHFALESNKSKTSNTGSHPHRLGTGKIPTEQSSNRSVNKASSRNPPPPKTTVPRVIPNQRHQTAKTLHPSSVTSCRAKKEEGSDVTLTVILTKKQDGEKPEISVMDKTSLAMRGGHAPGLGTGNPSKRGEQRIAPAKQQAVTKTITQATARGKSLPHNCRTGKPVANGGHIRIVSRLSLSGAKSQSANERSFLLKSSRIDGTKQPPNVSKERPEGNRQTIAHSAKPSTTQPVTMAPKKRTMAPVAAPKTRPSIVDYSLKRLSNTQKTQPLNRQVGPRRSLVTTGCNKEVDESKSLYSKREGVKEIKQQGVTGASKETATKPSNLTAPDASSRPQTPHMTAEDLKRKLQEWQRSKGKSYKRPPMVLPPKRPPTAKKPNPCNRSLWEGIEEEEELLALSQKINQTLSECLQLIEQGIPGDDIRAALDKVPEAKKFAKYWVCEARLLEREGVYDVIDVYKQGVQFGATPIDELREVVFDIMKSTNKKTKVVTFGPLPAEEETENRNYEDLQLTPFTNRTEEAQTPCMGKSVCDQGSAVKLQITSLSSKKMVPGSGQEWKRLTPVRRSLRIYQSASQYPEVVQEHDPVVASLEELLDQADTDAYFYMRNEALPEEADHSIISLTIKDPTEDQQEAPV
ncbi:cytoskeleton-associated protein 2-like isoform X2 [Dendrobates tinctorius]|uniref:cytoskeleton-associated protein 2-like isoform X2 n=1 Tax=Dendrobates tinctorius TaxID=92724 RepID=UPI003CC92DCD